MLLKQWFLIPTFFPYCITAGAGWLGFTDSSIQSIALPEPNRTNIVTFCVDNIYPHSHHKPICNPGAIALSVAPFAMQRSAGASASGELQVEILLHLFAKPWMHKIGVALWC